MSLDFEIKQRKKLIEVAIPLDEINAASVREKSLRHGHPSTLHLWWARRPLASARAIIFCQMVDDPSSIPEVFSSKESQEKERLRLFSILSDLVKWENSTNTEVLTQARIEIENSWHRCCSDNKDHPKAKILFDPNKLPIFNDPFSGGGSLPLEAQRLGLQSYAGDLNPVAVLITKSMIEIPPKFQGFSAVNPESRKFKTLFKENKINSAGLAKDVEYYGELVRKKAFEISKDLYPKIEVSEEVVDRRPDLKKYLGCKLTVMAWIWARTVPSPNPAFVGKNVPLVSTFILAKKKGKEAYVLPQISNGEYTFRVYSGNAPNDLEVETGTKLSRGGNFKCILSGEAMNPKYIKSCGKNGQMGIKLMSIVAEGDKERVYLDPTDFHENIALNCKADWLPDIQFVEDARAFTPSIYGLKTWSSLFTDRQLKVINNFATVIQEVKKEVYEDALAAGFDKNAHSLSKGGNGAEAYSEAIAVYLTFTLDRLLQQCCTLSVWSNNAAHELVVNAFGRQALAMTWDFGEINPFCKSASWEKAHSFLCKAVDFICNPKIEITEGCANQNAAQDFYKKLPTVISTDPPYYDNVPYADLSDFFYVWIRKSLQKVYPQLLGTLEVPKSEELTAFPYRHGDKDRAENFFTNGIKNTFTSMSRCSHPAFPVTIYYAFKQTETSAKDGTVSTGWETFLIGLIESGFTIKGTWPIRTEKPGRMIAQNQNALATSLVLVCYPRSEDCKNISRSEFRRKLLVQIKSSIYELEKANIAPVDLAQAVIGPGMSIFSSAKYILNPDDTKMSVRQALVEINSVVDECLSENDSELDEDSRFAVTFFESFGNSIREFGDAEGLAKARNVSVEGVVRAGILNSIAGKVNLIERGNLPEEWDPLEDDRLCIWEGTQHLIKRLELHGEKDASILLKKLKNISGEDIAQKCRSLAYRLYNHCEKINQAEEARAYNSLIISWPELERLAAEVQIESTMQTKLI